MDKKTRRQHSPQDKVRILRLHLLEGKPISEICEAEGIHPTLFYQWQKTFFEKGTAAFEGGRSPSRVFGQNERKIEALEGKLRRKDEVIAEIIERYADCDSDQQVSVARFLCALCSADERTSWHL